MPRAVLPSMISTAVPTASEIVSVTFTPAGTIYTPVTVTRTITVTQASPNLAWATPAAITQGTALTATQLNATATGVTGAALPGTFVYTPAAGTVPAAGTQTLSVTFTPNDTVDYTAATTTVRLTVTGLTLTSFTPNTANIGRPRQGPSPTSLISAPASPQPQIAGVNGTSIPTTYLNSTTLTAIVPRHQL